MGQNRDCRSKHKYLQPIHFLRDQKMHEKNVDIYNVIIEKLDINMFNNDIRFPSLANSKSLFHINLKLECKTLTMKLLEMV